MSILGPVVRASVRNIDDVVGAGGAGSAKGAKKLVKPGRQANKSLLGQQVDHPTSFANGMQVQKAGIPAVSLHSEAMGKLSKEEATAVIQRLETAELTISETSELVFSETRQVRAYAVRQLRKKNATAETAHILNVVAVKFDPNRPPASSMGWHILAEYVDSPQGMKAAVALAKRAENSLDHARDFGELMSKGVNSDTKELVFGFLKALEPEKLSFVGEGLAEELVLQHGDRAVFREIIIDVLKSDSAYSESVREIFLRKLSRLPDATTIDSEIVALVEKINYVESSLWTRRILGLERS